MWRVVALTRLKGARGRLSHGVIQPRAALMRPYNSTPLFVFWERRRGMGRRLVQLGAGRRHAVGQRAKRVGRMRTVVWAGCSAPARATPPSLRTYRCERCRRRRRRRRQCGGPNLEFGAKCPNMSLSASGPNISNNATWR